MNVNDNDVSKREREKGHGLVKWLYACSIYPLFQFVLPMAAFQKHAKNSYGFQFMKSLNKL